MDIRSNLSPHTGRSMPIMGLGTWELTDDTAGTVEEALRIGYRLIDTSGDYGTQPGIGKAIRRSDVDRTEIYVVTKVEEDEDAYEATRKNLAEMNQEYADLILIHRPPPSGAGVKLWQGLIRAKDDGLTRDIGVSNYTIDQIDDLADATGEMPAVNQIEWSPFGWSPDVLDHCRARGIIIQSYSPLTRTERLDDEGLRHIAAEYDKTPAQIILRWNLQLGVVPLPKANSKDHLHENLDVFDFELSDEHMEALNDFNEHYSSLSELPYV